MIIADIEPEPAPDERIAIEIALRSAIDLNRPACGRRTRFRTWGKRRDDLQSVEIEARSWSAAARAEALDPGV